MMVAVVSREGEEFEAVVLRKSRGKRRDLSHSFVTFYSRLALHSRCGLI